jgi:hypothetical protein
MTPQKVPAFLPASNRAHPGRRVDSLRNLFGLIIFYATRR